MRIFIPGNVPSLKNNKDIIQIPIKGTKPCPLCKHKKARPMLIPGKRHKQYVKDTMSHWIQRAYTFRDASKDLPRPLRIHLKFVRGSRHKFDWSNATETIQDLMVHYDWIDDDNSDEILPIAEPYEYDKEKPGVWIWLT